MNSMSNKKQGGDGSSSGSEGGAGSSLSVASVSSTQRRVAVLIVSLVEVLREASNNPELPAQAVALLMQVINSPEPMGVLELAKATGMSPASASRFVQALGRGMRGQEGADLLVSQEDPMNYSRKQVLLTPKGRALAARLEEVTLASIRKFK